MPVTASFVYVDVIALVLASILAATLTTVYVHKSPYSTLFSSASSDYLIPNGPEFHIQRKIGLENIIQNSRPHPLLVSPEQLRISYVDNTTVSRRITELLRLAEDKPNRFSLATTWSAKLIQTAHRRWSEGTIVLVLSNRQVFSECGNEDLWSISEVTDGILQITVGFLDTMEIELYMQRWHETLAYMWAYS